MDYPTIQNLNDSVSGILTGTDLDNVTDLYGAYQRAAAILRQSVYLPDSEGRQELVLYDGVTDYVMPSTSFGTTITDLRPQGNTRNAWDFVYKKPGEQFDREKKYLRNGSEIALESNRGVPIIRAVSTDTQQRVILDAMNSLTGWSAGGNAISLALDKTVFYDNNASLRFNISAGGTDANISKTLTSPVNLTDYIGVGLVFLEVRLPSATTITSVTVRVGSSASNYYQVTVTEAFISAFRVGEWLTLGFDLSTATTFGSPVATTMKYLYADCTYNGTALTNIYMGGMWVSLPSPHTLIFGSSAIFQHPDGSITGMIDNLTDAIILTPSAYNLYLHEAAAAVAFNMGGKLAGGQISNINQILHGVRGRTGALIQLGLYDLYKADNPNQNIQQTGNYYDD